MTGINHSEPLGWPEPDAAFQLETHFDGRRLLCLRDRPRSLHEMLECAIQSRPAGEALICGDFRCDWRTLGDLVEGFARALAVRGVGAGDRVILFLDNRAEFVIALFALARLGAIAVTVGVREQAPGLAYIAENSGAKAILHEASLVDRIPALPLTLAIGETDVTSFIAALEKEAELPKPGGVDEESTALLMYTSGTTGKPKGAAITHLALVHMGAMYTRCMALGAMDRSACVVPLSHISGITATVATMTFAAGCMVIVPSFDATGFAALVERERVTHSLLVPAMYNLLLARQALEGRDLSAWRVGAFGGAPMPTATIQALASALPSLQPMNCYGATETCGAATIMPADQQRAHMDSIGLAIPGVRIRAMKDAQTEAAPGETGELWIGGPTVAPGYWRNPEADRANFVDGYWRSGDLGSVDAQGFVRILDRLKDMINRGGYKIFSAEVEAILMEHPAVLEAAVVAKPCEILGERVHAFVALREGVAEVDPTELATYCATRMTDYKRPESFTIDRAPLPRNANGKVMKGELRDRLLHSRSGQQTVLPG